MRDDRVRIVQASRKSLIGDSSDVRLCVEYHVLVASTKAMAVSGNGSKRDGPSTCICIVEILSSSDAG
jgi:hypothetical protein